ncbi:MULTISPECIES: hypothetical protein [unclassified Sphingomonas]|uniref:hypothetical protein n=1 Tax=unclassified Sphingomonas TaxID=196159 RepID=UPI0022B4AC06|nr:hypothetical protein [Sphingomonas sp. NIBR02145]WHU01724.1 hypothetical protein O3305_16200 [Sphingomonas sp. NIBR02145]
MRIHLLLAATAGLALATIPPATPEARASTVPFCGTGLVAGLAICLSWNIKRSEYRTLVARANAGDRDAALTLAQFEDERDDIQSDGRKWWARAAQLGECQAIRKLRDDAASAGNARLAAHWRKQVDRYRCTVRVYGERWMGSRWLLGKQ